MQGSCVRAADAGEEIVVNAQSNWWEEFFEGPFVSLWLHAVAPEQTNQEAERLASLLALPPGAGVLDVPCGGGRVALALAARGYRVTGVDWSSEFLDHAKRADEAKAVRWERRDMRDLPWHGWFDGAFCVGNSFGYLDDEGNAEFLRAVRSALKPGARFVLETPMILESLFEHIQERPWWKVGDCHLLAENRYEHTASRLEIEYTIVSAGGVHVRRGSHRAYSYRELVQLIGEAGFTVEPAQPWTRSADGVTFVATAV
jgi:SAM-dependent methyltransferase